MNEPQQARLYTILIPMLASTAALSAEALRVLQSGDGFVPSMRPAWPLSLCSQIPGRCQGLGSSMAQTCSASLAALSCLQENQHYKKEKEEQHMAELATNAKNDEEVIAKLHKVIAQAGCDRMVLYKCLLVRPASGVAGVGDCTLLSCTRFLDWGCPAVLINAMQLQ